jgi:hypothetical protein
VARGDGGAVRENEAIKAERNNRYVLAMREV